MKPNLARPIFISLLTLILTLLLLNTWSYFYVSNYNITETNGFYKNFNFNEEKNLPSVFSGCLHFFASILLAIIASSRLKIKKREVFWWSLSIIFLFLGLDEILRIHEKLNSFVTNTIETSGVFFYAWVIPYGIALIVIALSYYKSLFELPKKTAINFIAAGFIFVSGALGMEMFTGWYIDFKNLEGLQINTIPEIFILYTIEELLEMLGISFFIYSLLNFLSEYKTIKSSRFLTIFKFLYLKKIRIWSS